MKNSLIEGSVDFIFGRDIVVFDSCQININRERGTLTAVSTGAPAMFSLVFLDCRITDDSIGFDGRLITTFHLGRPWQASPRTVFVRCDLPGEVDPAGWLAWNVTPALYAEYLSAGAGARADDRVTWSAQLTPEEAGEYTVDKIFAKNSYPGFAADWVPLPDLITAVHAPDGGGTNPASYTLRPNYPNPFNPHTTISFSLPRKSVVSVRIVDLLGREAASLFEGPEPAGDHRLEWYSGDASSGVCLCLFDARLRDGETHRLARKILLVR